MTALLGLLTALVVAGLVSAATPVTAGYRDFAIGGGVNRPTKDKPQSKLWFTDGAWFAGMFDTVSDAFKVHRLSTATHDWTVTGPQIDPRNGSHGDYLWDEGAQTLWVASTRDPDTTAPFDDNLRVYKLTYNAGTNAYTGAGSASIPGTGSVVGGEGGAVTVTIARDSGGRLWTVWPRATQIRYSISDDGGATWSTPAQMPPQIGNAVKDGATTSADIASVVAFGSNIGVLWSDHSESPSATTNGFYFASIAAGADPTVGANWSSAAKLPALAGASDGEQADNHINVKVAGDGTIYAVGKTGKDTINCTTNKDKPLIVFFKRTPAGVWSNALVSTVGDCSTRPQLVISDQLDVAYVFLTSPNGGGAIYMKSAPLTGPEAFKFRTADTTLQPGTPFIQSLTETMIDDPTTTKQVVTSTSDIVVLANNINPQPRYYLHNEMAIGGTTDTTDPVGTVAIDAGAAATSDTIVSVGVAATDTESGVSQVRMANVGTTIGGVLSGAGATTFAYRTPINWTIPGVDGTKTVYVQWRDAAGNWSAVANDTILLDTIEPSGTASIEAGATHTTDTAVSVAVPATDADSGLANVRLANTNSVDVNGVLNGAGATTFAYSTPKAWTLLTGDGTKTVYVQWQDAAGNWSAVTSDTIVLDSTDPTGTVSINGGAATTALAAVSVAVPATDAGSGVASVRLANSGSVDGSGVLNGAGATTSAYGTPKAWTLSAGDGTKTVYVQWKDNAGNWSGVKSDTIVLDTVRPTGTISINDGAAATGNSTVALDVPATDATSGVSQVRIANVGTTDGGGVLNGSGATTSAYAASKTWTLSSGVGTKTVYAQWKDAAGNWSSVVSDSIVVDSGLPPFTDIDGSTFYEDIKWLAASGITYGCTATTFCPNDPVTRGQMAAFLHRALPDLPLVKTPTEFTDDDGSTFEADIEWLSATGITYGCTATTFCPTASVTRGQMAAFLHRALPDLPLLRTPTEFTDDDGSTFEADIEWLSAAGITQGCTATTFCPTEPVTRGQMAAFLHRALGD